MRKIIAMIALLFLASCGKQYENISETQCVDWREVSGFHRDTWNGGYRSFDEIQCVVKEAKASNPG